MIELERLGVKVDGIKSIEGVGLNRTEMETFKAMADPDELLNVVISTPGYKEMNDNERALSLQLIVDQYHDDAEKQVFDTKNQNFRDLRQRIREAQ